MGFTDIFKIKEFKAEIEQLRQENQSLLSKNETAHKQLSDLGALDYYEIKEKTMRLENDFIEKEKQLKSDYSSKTQRAEDEFKKTISDFERMTSDRSAKCQQILEQLNELRLQEAKINKSVKTQTNKLNRSKELVKAINYTFDKYLNYEPSQSILRFPDDKLQELEEISPSVILKLHCMDVKDLRKAYRDNDKQIDTILKKYSARYTTKANQAIYKLMVIALRAELQNVLYNLKYEKLDKSVEDIKSVTRKYLKIAGEGNQSIAGTLAKFIGEIEYLFINAVKIEYNYYVKKEQARQEQLAIREQMRQEAEERKALEAERKKVEQEESKYTAEIEKLKEQLTVVKDNELEMLNARILELQAQLADVVIKKEEISNLANGKAGNVYVISNLGSFGNNVFKIGMTRRLNPQDRVNELGDASVPFKFDVHSFIFSEDAVSLENKLHSILNDKRVNKVNMRKEFFHTSVDELEELVTQIEPTAEFNKTMLAEEFRQSQSSESLYTSDYTLDDEEDEEE
ncbi:MULTISPECIES: GIY-YIG nuclease family protein [Clostridia]|uniref:GIY-YIG nuclease family protein n=1 Tax=Clostridia TaxID=186801 RepID=UPI00067EB8FB|nr:MULTISPECIES: GIY-YIG nuclease family protein [Clostridia]